MHLTAMLQQAAYAGGLDKPLDAAPGTPSAQAAALGPKVIEQVLVFAMQNGYAPAATEAARILGRIGTAGELLYQGAEPSPLVKAVRNPDRRLRFAAADAVLKLKPAEPFAGASYVTESLAFFAATTGTRRAIVAGPINAESMRVAGYLEALGYQVDTAYTGRDLIRLAMACPDYELALVDAGLQEPVVGKLLQQLRFDSRTADLPVGILAREDYLDLAKHMAESDRLAAAFPRPHNQETAAWQVARVAELAAPNAVAAAERQRQAGEAMEWLVELTAGDRRVFQTPPLEEVVRSAVLTPDISPAAVAVLGQPRHPRQPANPG